MPCNAASRILSSLMHFQLPESDDVSEVGYRIILIRRGSEKWLKDMGSVDKLLKLIDRIALLAAVITREYGDSDAASKLFKFRAATSTTRAISGVAKVAQGCIPDALRALRNIGLVIAGLWKNNNSVGLRTKKTEWDAVSGGYTCLENFSITDVDILNQNRYLSKGSFRCKLAIVGFKQLFTFVDKTCFSVAFLVFNPINVAGRFCGDAMSDSLRSTSKQGMTILMATCQSSALAFCFLDIGDAMIYGDAWIGFNDQDTGKITVLGTVWDRGPKIAVKSLQLSMSIINLGHIPVHPLVLPSIDLLATIIDLVDAVIKFNPNNPSYGAAGSPVSRRQAALEALNANSGADNPDG